MSPWRQSLAKMGTGGPSALDRLLPPGSLLGETSGGESARYRESFASPCSMDILPHRPASGNQLILSDERHDRANIEDVECLDEPVKGRKSPEVPLQVCSISSSSGNNSTEGSVGKDAIKHDKAALNDHGNGEVKKDKEKVSGRIILRGNKKALYRPKLEEAADHPLSTSPADSVERNARRGHVGDAIVPQNCLAVHGTGGQETKKTFEGSQKSINLNPLQDLGVIPAEDFNCDDVDQIFREMFSFGASQSVQELRSSIITGRGEYYSVRGRDGCIAPANTRACSPIGEDEEDGSDEEGGGADDEEGGKEGGEKEEEEEEEEEEKEEEEKEEEEKEEEEKEEGEKEEEGEEEKEEEEKEEEGEEEE